MMQDFDKKHWTTPCPKIDCRKDACKCGLKYVFISAVLGDDKEGSSVAPKKGEYCNAIVEYEATGSIYIYSAEGIPVLVRKGEKVDPISVSIVVDTSHETATYTTEEEGYALTARTFTTDPTGYEQYVTITVDGGAYEGGMLLQAGEHQVVYTLADGEGYTGATATYSITVTQVEPTPTEDWGSIVYYNSWHEGYNDLELSACAAEIVDQQKLADFIEAHGGYNTGYYTRFNTRRVWDEETQTYTDYWSWSVDGETDGYEVENSNMESETGIVVTSIGSSEEGVYIRPIRSIIIDEDAGTTEYDLTEANWGEIKTGSTINAGGVNVPKMVIKEIEFGPEVTNSNVMTDGKSVLDSTFEYLDKVNVSRATNVTDLGVGFCEACKRLSELVGLENVSLTDIKGFFLSQCQSFNQPLTIPSSVTEIGSYFLYMSSFNQTLTLPNSVISIGEAFLSSCEFFNQPITIPDSVVSIGDSFLSGCEAFNQELVLSESLESIGGMFLSGDVAFNQDLALPNTLTSIGFDFMNGCDAYTSTVSLGSLAADIAEESDGSFASYSETALCYTTGITLVGDNVADWMTRFPNTTDPDAWVFRKLIDGGTNAP